MTTPPDGPLLDPGAIPPFSALVDQVKEDWNTHDQAFMSPGFHAVATHRFGVWTAKQQGPTAKLLRSIYKWVNILVIRNVYGTEISDTTVLGRRVKIGHHQGVVLGYSTIIGDDCLIRQGVTLGQSNDEGRVNDQPVLGSRVELGAGAAIVGRVSIGDDARIGPGAVVTRNVPAGAIAFAPPARIIEAAPTLTDG